MLRKSYSRLLPAFTFLAYTGITSAQVVMPPPGGGNDQSPYDQFVEVFGQKLVSIAEDRLDGALDLNPDDLDDMGPNFDPFDPGGDDGLVEVPLFPDDVEDAVTDVLEDLGGTVVEELFPGVMDDPGGFVEENPGVIVPLVPVVIFAIDEGWIDELPPISVGGGVDLPGGGGIDWDFEPEWDFGDDPWDLDDDTFGGTGTFGFDGETGPFQYDVEIFINGETDLDGNGNVGGGFGVGVTW